MRIIPVFLAALLVAAHFLRAGNTGLAIACAATPALLWLRRPWVPKAMQGLTFVAVLVWVNTTSELIHIRRLLGASWGRLAVIMGAVILLTGLTALIYDTQKMKSRFQTAERSIIPSLVAFALVSITLAIIQLKVPLSMLLLDRFIPGGGWIEVLGFAVYAAWITEKMLEVDMAPVWRRRIWIVFSVVFFSQFAIGLLGFDRFLLTGELHIPVPALIAAGPVFRGEGYFMPILFASTLVLVGPAWCSHLCYIGALDFVASRRKRRPKSLPKWSGYLRWVILIGVIAAAFGLRWLGASIFVAAVFAIGFGVLGLGVMLTASRKTGAMTHCVVLCPIGLIADLLGKVSPFRIRLLPECTECGKCTKTCRYDALSLRHIKARRPGLNCTLCGDCLKGCKEEQIAYRFGPLQGNGARVAFLVLAVSVHAVFMAVARI